MANKLLPKPCGEQGSAKNWVVRMRKLGGRADADRSKANYSQAANTSTESTVPIMNKLILIIAALGCSSTIAAQQLQLRTSEPSSRAISTDALKAAGRNLKITTKNGQPNDLLGRGRLLPRLDVRLAS